MEGQPLQYVLRKLGPGPRSADRDLGQGSSQMFDARFRLLGEVNPNVGGV